MKKILLALTIIGASHISAEAQSKKSVFDKNYPVCLVGNTYQVCPQSNQASVAGRTEAGSSTEASLRMMDTSVYLGYGQPFNSWMVPSNRNNPRIRVTIDDPNAAYQGEESMINDGVQQNKERNINYLDTSMELPPNDGGISNR